MGLIEGDHFDDHECLELLRRSQVGRVGLSIGAVPAVVPVRYEMQPGGIVLASSIEQVAKAMEGAVIALQCDGFDEDERKRWTVLAVGTTERIDPYTIPATSRAPHPGGWDASHFFWFRPEVFSGRWLEGI